VQTPPQLVWCLDHISRLPIWALQAPHSNENLVLPDLCSPCSPAHILLIIINNSWKVLATVTQASVNLLSPHMLGCSSVHDNVDWTPCFREK
jgi:hypothetical protein